MDGHQHKHVVTGTERVCDGCAVHMGMPRAAVLAVWPCAEEEHTPDGHTWLRAQHHNGCRCRYAPIPCGCAVLRARLNAFARVDLVQCEWHLRELDDYVAVLRGVCSVHRDLEWRPEHNGFCAARASEIVLMRTQILFAPERYAIILERARSIGIVERVE